MTEQIHYIDPQGNQEAASLELLKSRVQNIKDEEELLTYLKQLERLCGIDNRGDRNSQEMHKYKLYYNQEHLVNGFPIRNDLEVLNGKYNRYREALGELRAKATSLGVITKETENIMGDTLRIYDRIANLRIMVTESYKSLNSNGIMNDLVDHPTMVSHNPDIDLTEDTIENRSPLQNLLISLLEEIYNNRYRRYKGQCCVQVKTLSGYTTRSWKPIMTIQEFIYETANRDKNPNMWSNLTQKGNNAHVAADYLSKCKETEFPEINKNRHVWAFNNGLFVGKEWNPAKGCWISRFYPYENPIYHYLDPTIVASKYFDLPFYNHEDIADWWDIPTPHFQSVLDYQNFDEDVSKWMYVMGGRLCFDVGDIDCWQVIPFLKGIARSGKSTLITKVFKKFYEGEDVKTLSNNIERKFGLSSICDGLMFIAPEVKGDLCLEQAEFQSLVSGEDVSIAVKHQQAKSVEWKTPGILGGNEIPNWKDNSGSVLRRILPWNFSKQVMEADPHLDIKLEKELPAIIEKCVRGYLEYAQRYSSQDIWNVVPQYFKNIQNQVAMVTNSLQNFLASEKVRYGTDLFCPQKLFVQIFFQHCQENNLGRSKFNPDFYAGPFSSKGLEVRKKALTYKGRAYPEQEFIYGIDVVEDTIQFGEDY